MQSTARQTIESWRTWLVEGLYALAYVGLFALWLGHSDAVATPVATAGDDGRVATARASTDKGGQEGAPGRPAKKGGPVEGFKLDINSATVSEWEQLPGIGPSKAEAIVAWRAKHGPFRRIVDLRRVKGIGQKTLKRLEPFLLLGPVGGSHTGSKPRS